VQAVIVHPVAQVYAEALFRIGVEHRTRAQLQEELEMLCALLEEHPDLALFLEAPGLAPSRKVAAMERLLGPDFSELFRNFVCVLIEKRRSGLLPEIRQAFQELADGADHRLRATVTSAVPLAPDRLREVEEILRSRTGAQEVVLTTRVDPTLIGGMIIRHDDTRIDCSLRSRLATVRHRLASRHALAAPGEEV
jgi:F-type H+-transporting ATPase subunit delta